MDLSIIILNWNTKDLLLQCLKSVYMHTKGIKFEVVVCDNGSGDGSVEAIEEFRSSGVQKFRKARKQKNAITLIRNKANLGFSAGNNPGLKKATGRYLMLLNTDTKIDYDVFSKLVKWMDEHEQVGICGPKLLRADGGLQPSGGYLPSLWGIFCQQVLPMHVLWQWGNIAEISTLHKVYPLPTLIVTNHDFYTSSHQVGWVQGSAFMIRREVYEQIGGLDENIFMYVEETEYCKRAIDAGWEIWYVADEYIYHLERGSSVSGKEGAILGTYKGLRYYFWKHKSAWQVSALVGLLKLGALVRLPRAPKIYWRAFNSV